MPELYLGCRFKIRLKASTRLRIFRRLVESHNQCNQICIFWSISEKALSRGCKKDLKTEVDQFNISLIDLDQVSNT